MDGFAARLWEAAGSAAENQRLAGILLLWSAIAAAVAALLWPRGRGRRLARQTLSLAVLGFREGVRLRILWTVALIALIPAILAYFSDADGTHAGRARVILNVSLTCGEVFGAALIVLLSALSVAREIESRIMHTLGTKPAPRWVILLGKALGFWAIDLLFLGGLVLLTAALVWAVPLRPETRQTGGALPSGTWEDLRRTALTTRHFRSAIGRENRAYSLIKPGTVFSERFNIDPGENAGEPFILRMLLSSSAVFNTQIQGLRVQVGYEAETPFFDKTLTVAQDRPFEVLLPARDTARAVPLAVSLTPGRQGPQIIPYSMQMGVRADGFVSNLSKAFLLMALQGWVLALILTGWSGVLSFPVTVALGVILILGGELSRQAVELMQSNFTQMGLRGGGGLAPDHAFQESVAGFLRGILLLLPDFRAAGGPASFVEGAVISGWAIAHAAFWMGVVRALGWAAPGAALFQSREVGR